MAAATSAATEVVSGAYGRTGIDEPYNAAEGVVKVVEGMAAVLFAPPKPKVHVAKRRGEGTAADKPAETEAPLVAVPAAPAPDADVAPGPEKPPQSVFYNEAQVVNRDLSICILTAFAAIRRSEPRKLGGTEGRGITVLEALSASGLRAIRYFKEVAGIRRIVANDMDPDAVASIHRNVTYNGIPVAGSVAPGAASIEPNRDDAIILMQRLAWPEPPHTPSPRELPLIEVREVDAATGATIRRPLQSEKQDAIDLDPYGTAVPFLDSAVAAVREGGLLLVTCTDSAILCGNYPETCRAKYGGTSLKSDACHEIAARLVLASIESAANRHNRYIVPLLSLHIDFYVRVFVRVYTQAAEVKRSGCKLGYLFHCNRCPAFWVQPLQITKEPRSSDQMKRPRQTRADTAEAAAEAAASAIPKSATTGAADPSAAGHAHAVFPEPPPRSANVHFFAVTTDRAPSRCTICGSRVQIGGPAYCAPMHNAEFLADVLKVIEDKGRDKLAAYDRIRGLVRSAQDELPNVPLFYKVAEVASALKMRVPQAALVHAALARLGYAFSQTHCTGQGLKTSAPPEVIFGILRHIRDTKKAALKAGEHDDDGPLPEYIRVAPVAVDFSYDARFDVRSSITGEAKFIPNLPFWGPKARHVGAADAS